ncbi:hypothetical protein HDU96_009610 [Phlyctochytrium bullatum]|nr:hypothetical protein HDU96_009610 [Phlyctochytrium bullatum]
MTNVRLVQMVAAWGFAALFVYFFIAFWFFFGSRARETNTVDNSVTVWQRRLEFFLFGKRSPFSDSKDVLKDIAQEIGHLFHDFDWAPSDIVLGLILIKREQKRLSEVLQAKRILMERAKIRAARNGGKIPTTPISNMADQFVAATATLPYDNSPGSSPGSHTGLTISAASPSEHHYTFHRFQHCLVHEHNHIQSPASVAGTPVEPATQQLAVVPCRKDSQPSGGRLRPTAIKFADGDDKMSAVSPNLPLPTTPVTPATPGTPATPATPATPKTPGTPTTPTSPGAASVLSPRFRSVELRRTMSVTAQAVSGWGESYDATLAEGVGLGPARDPGGGEGFKVARGQVQAFVLANRRPAGYPNPDDMAPAPPLSNVNHVPGLGQLGRTLLAPVKEIDYGSSRSIAAMAGSNGRPSAATRGLAESNRAHPLSNDATSPDAKSEDSYAPPALLRSIEPLKGIDVMSASPESETGSQPPLEYVPPPLTHQTEPLKFNSVLTSDFVSTEQCSESAPASGEGNNAPAVIVEPPKASEGSSTEPNPVGVVSSEKKSDDPTNVRPSSSQGGELIEMSQIVVKSSEETARETLVSSERGPTPQYASESDWRGRSLLRGTMALKVSESPSSSVNSQSRTRSHSRGQVQLETDDDETAPKVCETPEPFVTQRDPSGESTRPVVSPPMGKPGPKRTLQNVFTRSLNDVSGGGSPPVSPTESGGGTEAGMKTGNGGRSGSKFGPFIFRRDRHRNQMKSQKLKKTGNVMGTIMREDVDDILHYAKFAEVVYAPDEVNSMFDVSGRLLRHNPTNQLFLSPYFIVYDPETDAIIIAIRGTFSIADVLVDLKFDLAEFEIPELHAEEEAAALAAAMAGDVSPRPRTVHWAHSGMLRTARNIVEDIKKEDILRPVLTDDKSEYKGCPLVVTGHSLGAGVAALVACILRADYPSACCYAYEPPGCLLSAKAAQYFESFCVSVIMGDDIVPRISRNSMEFLKSDLARLISTCDIPKWRVFQSVLGERRRKRKKKKKPANAEDSQARVDSMPPDLEVGNVKIKFPKTPKELLDMLMSKKGNTPEEEEILQKAVDYFITHDPAFSVERVLQFTPMFVPGRIFYIEKHRRPPQAFLNAFGGALNTAGEKLKDGLQAGADNIKDVFTGKHDRMPRKSMRQNSIDHLERIGTRHPKRGMSVSLNDVSMRWGTSMPGRADRGTLSSFELRQSHDAERHLRDESLDIGAGLPFGIDERRRSRGAFGDFKGVPKRSHTRRLSADDIVIHHRALDHAKSAPDMFDSFNPSPKDVTGADDSKKAQGHRVEWSDPAPKPASVRGRSRDRARAYAASAFSLDMEREYSAAAGRNVDVGGSRPDLNAKRSVDDIVTAYRRRSVAFMGLGPATSNSALAEGKQRHVGFKQSANNIYGSQQIQGHAPRLIASAARAPSISIAINHADQPIMARKNTQGITLNRPAPFSPPGLATSIISKSPSSTVPTAASSNAVASPISPAEPRASTARPKMVRQQSTIVPFTVRNAINAAHSQATNPALSPGIPGLPTVAKEPSSRPSIALANFPSGDGESVKAKDEDAARPSDLNETVISGSQARTSVDMSKAPQSSAYAVKKCGVPTKAGVRRAGKYHYVPRWANKEEFNEIIISRSTVADHSPFTLLKEFQNAPDGSILGVMHKKKGDDDEEDIGDKMNMSDTAPDAQVLTVPSATLGGLPTELLEVLVLYCGYNLALCSRRLHCAGDSALTKARLLLIIHQLATPSDFVVSQDSPIINALSSLSLSSSLPSHFGSASITNLDKISSDEHRSIKLQTMVQDPRFTPEIGIVLLKQLTCDPQYVETLSEYACIMGAMDIIQTLYPIEAPALRLGTDKLRNEALIQACLCNRPDVAKHMLQAGSDHTYANYSSLGMACKHGAAECVAELIKYGVDVNSNDGFALVWASRMGHVKIIEMLLEAGADPLCRGGLPLMWAAEHGQLKAMEVLLSKGLGGDKTMIHVQDDYCLRWAAARGHFETVEKLLSWGAAVHAMDDFALRHAVHFGHGEVVELLCKWGANPMAAEGESLREAARDSQSPRLDDEIDDVSILNYATEDTIRIDEDDHVDVASEVVSRLKQRRDATSASRTEQIMEDEKQSNTEPRTTQDGGALRDSLERELRRISQEVAYWKRQVAAGSRQGLTPSPIGTFDTEEAEYRWLNGSTPDPAGSGWDYSPAFVHERAEWNRDSRASEVTFMSTVYHLLGSTYPQLNQHRHSASLGRSEFSINLVRATSHSPRQSISTASLSLPRRQLEWQHAGEFREYHVLEPTHSHVNNERGTTGGSPHCVDLNDARDANAILASYNQLAVAMERNPNINVEDSLASPLESLHENGDGEDAQRAALLPEIETMEADGPPNSYEYFSKVWAYATSSIWSSAGTVGEMVGNGTRSIRNSLTSPRSSFLGLDWSSGFGTLGEDDHERPHYNDVELDGVDGERSVGTHRVESPLKFMDLNSAYAVEPHITPSKPAENYSLSRPQKFSELEAILDRLPRGMEDQRCDLASVIARRKAAKNLKLAQLAEDDERRLGLEVSRVEGQEGGNAPLGAGVPGPTSPGAQPGGKDSMLVKVLKRSMGMGFKKNMATSPR